MPPSKLKPKKDWRRVESPKLYSQHNTCTGTVSARLFAPAAAAALGGSSLPRASFRGRTQYRIGIAGTCSYPNRYTSVALRQLADPY